VHRDLVKSGRWSTEAGAAFSWLAGLRSLGDYGGGLHVEPDDAQGALDRARLLLGLVREALVG
jgi:hypothetical protein